MGRIKTNEEKMNKRLKAKAEAKLLAQDASEKSETAKLPEKIIRRPSPVGAVTFGSDGLRQKKG